MGYSLESTKILKYNVMRGKLIKKCCIGEDEERKRRKCHFQGLCVRILTLPVCLIIINCRKTQKI